MRLGLLRVVAATSILVTAAACGPTIDSDVSTTIALITPQAGGAAYVEVAGLSGSTLGALEGAALTPEEWSQVLRVAVDPEAPPMLGRYAVVGGTLRFTPIFPLDEGRQYQVRFDPARVPGEPDAGGAVVDAMVGLPASTAVPSTVVARVYPTGDVVPENMLRMYVEFSGPMGRKSGVEYIALLDSSGQEIPGAVLPLDYEFWSPDHTRFTVFFDPGRVKEGILPNQQMGRPLEVGTSVTLVISSDWLDTGIPTPVPSGSPR
jgi:hypothetical protein